MRRSVGYRSSHGGSECTLSSGATAPFVAALQPVGAFARLGAAWSPPCCLLCGGKGQSGLDLCPDCLSILPAMHRRYEGALSCIGCGERIDERADASVPPEEADAAFAPPSRCRSCRHRSSTFQQTIAPWRFAVPVDSWVRALKHDGRQVVARVFGGAIARAVVATSNGSPLAPSHARPDTLADKPPWLIPVPLHRQRRRARGFNQAEAIARWVGRDLGLAVQAQAAVRVLDTGSLAERSRAERQLAIRGAFRVHADIADRHVVLIDDVLTSGATASELARECHDTGAASVSVWVAARTCVAFDSNRDSTGGNPA